MEILTYDTYWRAIFCQLCMQALRPESTAIERHLRHAPHYLKGVELADQVRHGMAQPLSSLDKLHTRVRCLQEANVAQSPISHLPVLSGYRCLHCTHWQSLNERNTQKHVAQRHGLTFTQQQSGQDWIPCSLQTLFRQTGEQAYFEVTPTVEATPSSMGTSSSTTIATTTTTETTISRSLSPTTLALYLYQEFGVAQQQLSQTLSHRKQDLSRQLQLANAHKTEIPSWIKICGFEKFLDGLDKQRLHASWAPLDQSTSNHLEGPPEVGLSWLISQSRRSLGQLWHQTQPSTPNTRLTWPMAVVLSQFWAGTAYPQAGRVSLSTAPHARIRAT
ncbi:MAG: hypothetical protein M1837_002973 [Sclerophora amabilis]|nr:MAG: hypothetical protein M1837_002973 [Sclerophora amabilis]